MGRLLFFLPLCLFLQDQRSTLTQIANMVQNEAQPVQQKPPRASLRNQELLGCLAGNSFQVFPGNVPWVGIQQVALGKWLQPAQELLAGLAATPCEGFPGNLPWLALDRVGSRRQQAIEKLIREQPTVFLQMCLDRYDRNIQSYSCTLIKRERVAGKLKDTETVECHFREKPFSVYMNWLKNPGKAQRVLYVRGENGDKMLCRPSGILYAFGVIPRDVDGSDAKESGRYIINEFGMKLGTERTLNAMLQASQRNALYVKYEGMYRVPEADNRLCYKIVRTPYLPPEDEGVNELTLFIDTETWQQVGSILKGTDGKLIAKYYFRDLVFNPQFQPNQFTRKPL